MDKNGLTKLIEECGELIQIAAKKSAFMHTDMHPDCTDMRDRMEDEIADVLAACDFVMKHFQLNQEAIFDRSRDKFRTFEKWHKLDD